MTNSPDNITELHPNEVFVFGSNLKGQHLGGAAWVALGKFGAKIGVGEGLIGQAYAFPTLDENMQKRTKIALQGSVIWFRKTAQSLPALTFYLTKVGCGIAGYSENSMKKLFEDVPPNVIKPEGW